MSSDNEARNGNRLSGVGNVSYRTKQIISNSLLLLVLSSGLLVLIFPLYWMVRSSISPTEILYSESITLIPRDFTLNNFEAIFVQSDFTLYYMNSITYAAGVIVLTTTTATFAGYGLTRLEIPFKKTFARTILFGYMFPPILLAIPMFIFWRRIGILDSYIGLILAETAVTLPFSIWLMWKFFQTVPESLEESARMAGASRFRAFYEVALPLAMPGMIAVAIFSYAASWNQFTIPRVLMKSAERYPLTIGLYSFTQGYNIFWGQIMAASALVILPSFIFVFFLQKYMLQGFRTV